MAWEDRAYHREGSSFGNGPKLIFPMPSRLVFALIITCVGVFLAQAFTGSAAAGSPLVRWGALEFDNGIGFKQPWRWVTYQYLHASGGHLFFNLITIYFFVPMVERIWGWKRTLGFYTLGGIAAGFTYFLICLFYGPAPLIGASGSIMAMIGAATAIAPDAPILMQMIIPVTMRTMALLYTILYVFTIIGDRNTADAAHLGGLAFGFLAVWFGAGFWGRLNRRVASAKVVRADVSERQEQETVDRILQKVSEQGMQSLTRAERKALKLATERQRLRDLQVARKRT